MSVIHSQPSTGQSQPEQQYPPWAVTSGSPAAQAGLSAGDQIVSLGGHRVTSPSGIQSVLVRYHPGDKISIGWLDQAGRSHTATWCSPPGQPPEPARVSGRDRARTRIPVGLGLPSADCAQARVRIPAP